jgi:hypothetical protein
MAAILPTVPMQPTVCADGDPFARKFHNGDWFKLTVHGYLGGVPNPDSVTFYLADFLFPDSTMNYISE